MLRRQFLSSFAVSATTGGLIAAAPAPVMAMSLEPAPAHLRLGVAAPEGALDWGLLAQAGETRFRDGAVSRFPATLRALQGQEVRISGYMMPFRDAPKHAEFLLGGLQFHCPSCMSSDLTRIVAVRAAKPLTHSDEPVLVRGTLRLIEEQQSPLFFRLDGARAA